MSADKFGISAEVLADLRDRQKAGDTFTAHEAGLMLSALSEALVEVINVSLSHIECLERAEAAEAKSADLQARLNDMTDRYHEASNEADLLRDRIDHAPAYAAMPSAAAVIVERERVLTALETLINKITRHGSMRIRAFIAEMRQPP